MLDCRNIGLLPQTNRAENQLQRNLPVRTLKLVRDFLDKLCESVTQYFSSVISDMDPNSEYHATQCEEFA